MLFAKKKCALQYLLVELVKWIFIATFCADKTEEKILPTLGKNILKRKKTQAKQY